MDEKNPEMIIDDLQTQAIPEVPEEQAPVYTEEAPAAECFTAPVYPADPQEGTEYIPAQDAYAPVQEAVETFPEQPQSEAPAKPKKKLNKKVLFGIIGALVLVAVVIALIAVLTGGPKNTGLYLKDGEICLFVEGMDEPVELTSRLWKDAEPRDFFRQSGFFSRFIAVRNDGKRIFFPDRYSEGSITLYYQDVNKLDEEPVKIDSDINFFDVTEDGNTMLYLQGDKGALYLYDIKKEEETKIDSGIVQYNFTEDFSKICYRTDDGKVYIWTAETEDVKVAKDASYFYYYPETDMLFVMTTDGELLRKTAEMEEAEEIAEEVSKVIATYATGEVYFVRQSSVERNLVDYFDDDMKDADAALTQPKKPNYPSAPRKPYYWNYDVYADYEEALAEYNTEYAKYLETYNKMQDEYNAALEQYYLKLDRDEIRGRIESRDPLKYTEYALYIYNGTEEVLLTEALTSSYVEALAGDAAVLVYETYLPEDVTKLKMSEVEDAWDAPYQIMDNITNALYGQREFRVSVGGESTVIEETAGFEFIVSDDGAAIYFLDTPFTAFDGKRPSVVAPDAPAVEAPAVDAPAADAPAASDEEEQEEEPVIPEEQREYAGLYKIAIAEGQVGAPELVDEDISVLYAPKFTVNGDLVYFKDVDNGSGELYVNGQLITDDVLASSHLYPEGSGSLYVDVQLNFDVLTYHKEYLLFFTDWDWDDSCGTLCMVKLGEENAEVIEIDDEIYDFQVSFGGDLYYLQDFNAEKYEGTLFLYDMKKGESVEIDDDIIALLPIN